MGADRDRNLLFLLGGLSLACAVGDESSPFQPGSPVSFGGGNDDGQSASTGEGDTAGETAAPDDGAPPMSTEAGDAPEPDEGPLPDEGPGDASTAGGDAMDDAGPVSTEDGPADTGTPMDTGPGSDEGGGPPVTGDVCVDYAANTAFCFGGDPEELEYTCYDDLAFYAILYGPACATAWEDLYACIATVSCAEYKAGAGCDPQVAAVNSAC